MDGNIPEDGNTDRYSHVFYGELVEQLGKIDCAKSATFTGAHFAHQRLDCRVRVEIVCGQRCVKGFVELGYGEGGE